MLRTSSGRQNARRRDPVAAGAPRDAFLLFFHSWATHMPPSQPGAKRRRTAGRKVLAGIQSDSASALEATAKAYREAVRRQSEVLVASLLEELETLGLRESGVAFLSDHGESWGERFAAEERMSSVYPCTVRQSSTRWCRSR